MNDDMGAHFNLVDEPWIPVVYLEGTPREVSLRRAFGDAPRIRSLSGDIPQQSMAMLRLLLTVLYRSYRSPDLPDLTKPEMLEAWTDMWSRGEFYLEAIDVYLDDWHDRFDLFGEVPLYQVPGLAYDAKDKEFDPISEVIADVPKRERYLFSTRSKLIFDRGVSFAEAARWLLFHQAYDCAGIKTPVAGNSSAKSGKAYAPKGLPSTGWMGSIGSLCLEGANLFETLMLNWVLFNPNGDELFLADEDDLPAWERPVPSPDSRERRPTGPCDLYTWQSRRARLVLSEDGSCVEGIVSCYGDLTQPVDAARLEMMTAWHPSEAQRKKLGTPYVPLMPVRHVCGRALWRGLTSVIARGDDDGADCRPGVVRWLEYLQRNSSARLPDGVALHAQGVEYGPQSSSLADAFDDAVDVCASMARQDAPAVYGVTRMLNDTDDAVYQLVLLARNIERACGDKRQGNPLSRVDDDVRAHAYAELDELCRDRIARFSEEEDAPDYCAWWRLATYRTLCGLADEYVARSGARRFARHDGKSVAEAERTFRMRAREILGPFPADGSAVGVVPGDIQTGGEER